MLNSRRRPAVEGVGPTGSVAEVPPNAAVLQQGSALGHGARSHVMCAALGEVLVSRVAADGPNSWDAARVDGRVDDFLSSMNVSGHTARSVLCDHINSRS